VTTPSTLGGGDARSSGSSTNVAAAVRLLRDDGDGGNRITTSALMSSPSTQPVYDGGARVYPMRVSRQPPLHAGVSPAQIRQR
jgi:hypothetical protein